MPAEGYLLGYHVGNSFVKASLLESDTGALVASASSPEKEMEVIVLDAGWAEQDPRAWWENVKLVTRLLRNHVGSKLDDVRAIGISYQMHGLVLVDNNFEVLRPAILGNDSRAVDIGEQAFVSLGEEVCLKRLLNSPGNFTASKLKWVMENEYDIYKRIHKMMLPGDYIGMMMTGEILTTPSGLSEGIMWDFFDDKIADMVLRQFNIQANLIPNVVPNFFDHGVLTSKAASELDLKTGIKVSYRAGAQPNDAFSLNVLNPGEAAASVGTSGVIYYLADKPIHDLRSRINTFLHINHSRNNPRYGVLLCVKGAGILNRWLKKNVVTFGSDTLTYNQMNRLAELITAGSEELVFLPYGSGAERTLDNKNIGAAICNLDLNIHSKAHILRAAQEGIAFAFKHGVEIISGMGLEVQIIKANSSGMFLSSIFCESLSTVMNVPITLYDTDSTQGAARGAGVGAGIYSSLDEALIGIKPVKVIEPNQKKRETYLEAYLRWCAVLNKFISDVGTDYE